MIEEKIHRVYTVQVGDIFSLETPEAALRTMIYLHEHGIESCLHSYWNEHVCNALEIKHISKPVEFMEVKEK